MHYDNYHGLLDRYVLTVVVGILHSARTQNIWLIPLCFFYTLRNDDDDDSSNNSNRVSIGQEGQASPDLSEGIHCGTRHGFVPMEDALFVSRTRPWTRGTRHCTRVKINTNSFELCTFFISLFLTHHHHQTTTTTWYPTFDDDFNGIYSHRFLSLALASAALSTCYRTLDTSRMPCQYTGVITGRPLLREMKISRWYYFGWMNR